MYLGKSRGMTSRCLAFAAAALACGSPPPTAAPTPSAPPPAAAPAAAVAPPVAPVPPGAQPVGPDGPPSIPGVDWIRIPATEAWIGAQRRDPKQPGFDALAGEDDLPPRQVKVGAFEMMRTEVPLSVWTRCEAAGACTPRTSTFGEETPDTALRGVTFAQAEQLCSFIGGRVPTGPEWEIAARGNLNHRYAWGNGVMCPVDASEMVGREDRQRARLVRCPDVAARIMRTITGPELQRLGQTLLLYSDADWDQTCEAWGKLDDAALVPAAMAKADALLGSALLSTEVPDCGTPRLNTVSAGPASLPFGLVFMSGNVSEWTHDAGPGPDGPLRAVRGGSFTTPRAIDYRLAARTLLPPDAALQDVGVRCARGG